jgi:YD repeat-containing protein
MANAKTKSVTIHKYDIYYPNGPDNPPSQTGYKASKTLYDENGNILEELKFRPDGKLDEKYIALYDPKGHLLEEKSFLDDPEPADHKTYERDENGKAIRMFRHYIDGSKDTINITYDAQNHPVRKETIDSYDEVESIEERLYDGDNLIKRKITEYDEVVLDETLEYDQEGNLMKQTKWSIEEEDITWVNHFNPKGNLIKSFKYGPNEKLLSRMEYHYNHEGQLTEMEEETGYGIKKTMLDYDDQGNAVSQQEYNEQGKVISQVTRKYNENHQVTEMEVFLDFNGQAPNQHYTLQYEYTYY